MNKKYLLICEVLNYASLRRTAISRLKSRFKGQLIPQQEIGIEISKLIRGHWRTMSRI